MSAGIVSSEQILRAVADVEVKGARGDLALLRTEGLANIYDRHGRIIHPGQRCGTEKGYDDHRRRGEQPCERCRKERSAIGARREQQRRLRMARNAVADLLCPCESCQVGFLL
jgi:hypothetical protein